MEFGGAGKKPGLEIWRIEKMVPVVWSDHGKFCSGDSYIVLKTTAVPGKTSYTWDIHFWLGSETSQDEAGVAAYKTVELDELLGGAPVQHREVQGFESDKFLSYFKQGIQYLSGGVESGFTKVERDKYETRLLHCKGAKNVRVTEVPVSVSSLNSGDVFVLDCGLTLYQWNGKDANRKEKAKGLDVTAGIKNNERGGRAKVVVFDQGSETDDFWSALGGKGAVAEGDARSDNQADEAASHRKLLRLSASNGSVATETVAEGTFKKAVLDTNHVFIVDAGNPIMVWVGKNASAAEKKESMILAQNFINQEKRPKHTKITKVIEGGETPLFREQFVDWTEFRAPSDFSKVPGSSTAKKVEQKEVNVDELLSHTNPADTLIDDGSGKLTIWRIENFDKKPVPADLYGRFYAGDSYICLYTYKQGSKECYIIYFWQGRNSTPDERGASAILATKLDDELHGAATQVRVVQGKEPSHFLSLFKGKMIIYSGGTASGFKNKADADNHKEGDGTQLFHVKGTNHLNTRAVQIETSAARLNSGDSFILKTTDRVFAWFGHGSNGEERQCARVLANELKSGTVFREVLDVEEGSEDLKFWTYLGGKQEYSSSKELLESPHEPRLFQCSNATGQVAVEEVNNYGQDDLDDNDVFLLDVWSEVYVWIGKGSNESERKAAMSVAQKFVERTPSRSADTPIIQVPAGKEPPMFTSAFLGWDATVAQEFEDPYEKKLRLLKEKNNQGSSSAPAAAGSSSSSGSSATAAVASSSSPAAVEQVAPVNYDDPATTSFTYEQLLEKPATVDPTRREQYLNEADFLKVFKISKTEFNNQKQWKKDQLKKDKKLF
eukprot:c15680_g1_i1.p1 GENE.c15680_g1_i1~~c15680_g1_i1.p1  ORF type:complete len:835 (-),score=375.35 c15680_g1_i1:37-2541(-)